MKSATLKYLFFIALLANFSSSAQAHSPDSTNSTNTISGTVKDPAGRPLEEVTIIVHAGNSTQKPLKITKTDKSGSFHAADLHQGQYTLIAKASGYQPVQFSAAISRAALSPVVNVKLTPVSDLLTEDQKINNYKYVLRRNRSILHLDNDPRNKPTLLPETHGEVYFALNHSEGDKPTATGVNFAITQQLSEELAISLTGQAGTNGNQRLDSNTTFYWQDNHQFNIGLGYSSFTPNAINLAEIKQYRAQFTDQWRVSSAIALVYGIDYTRLESNREVNYLAPPLGATVDLSNQDQITAIVYSPNQNETTPTAKLTNVVDDSSFNPQTDYVRRRQISYRHRFNNESQITVSYIDDTISRDLNSLNMLSINSLDSTDTADTATTPTPTLDLQPSKASRRETQTVTLVFRQPLHRNLIATLAYANGTTTTINSDNTPQDLQNQPAIPFNVLSGRIDARVVRTQTKLSAVYQIATRQALLALDPFNNQVQTFNPGFSIYVTQTVPTFSFIPGQWEALVDARNLFDTGNRSHFSRLGHYRRIIQGGLSVRF
jgi:hypothetical protein